MRRLPLRWVTKFRRIAEILIDQGSVGNKEMYDLGLWLDRVLDGDRLVLLEGKR